MGHNTHGAVKMDKKNYSRWYKIKQRCYDDSFIMYKYYGGRNIKMGEEWINDPISFINYIKSLKNYGEVGFTLDRINNDDDYKTGNLRWASKSEQAINRRVRKNNVTGYSGITLFKRTGKYQCKISINKIKVHLGTFNTIEEAVIVRDNYIISNNIKEYKLQWIT